MMLRSYEKEAAKAILNSPIATLHKTEIEHPKWYHFFTTAAALTWADSYDSEKYKIAKNAHPIISKIPPTAHRVFYALLTLTTAVLILAVPILSVISVFCLSLDLLVILVLLPLIALLYSDAPENTAEAIILKIINKIVVVILQFSRILVFQFFALYIIMYAILNERVLDPISIVFMVLLLGIGSIIFNKILSINPLTIGVTSKRFFVFFKVINPAFLSIVLFLLAIYTQVNENILTMRIVNTAVLVILGAIIAIPLTQYRHVEKSILTLIRTIHSSQINLQTIQHINHDPLVDSALSLDNLFAEKVFGASVPNTGMFLLETRINILLYFDSIAHAQRMNQIHYRETANNNSNLNIHCKILEDYITLLIARYVKNDKYQKLLMKQTQRAYIKLQSVPVEQQIKDLNSFLYNIAKYLQ
ncbi:hypothetical protein GCM10007377_11180 [Galliscardovia ingluviei]|uniref:Uncharacterized protein n=1 Tax=Galliscardovia ingluviei TaxID=1769422 RepID=A0A8J3AHC0_9BIFI|nr:hypothetical protein [Galliscardovia ingluviei]GGI14487.1 hypothetical protein GCM10007377_11180 [Galliscardovia ingluviei]